MFSRRQILITAFFIFFIFLNIIDFMNLIGGDLDFFKKILSWMVIAYVFYSVGFTRILIGERLSGYEIAFILAFSLTTLVRTLTHYANSFYLNNVDSFFIFSPFLDMFLNYNLVNLSFFLGIILSIVLTISIIVKHEIFSNSLLGEIRFRNEFFTFSSRFFAGIFITLFFSLIVFNMMMEWFALAVDAVVLVLGCFYYLFKLFFHFQFGRFGNLARDISNSGNLFYQNLIEKFSSWRSVSVALAFLLVLHLAVDAGVYLVPYTLGTENTLYFERLGIDEHRSIVSILSFSLGYIYQDMQELGFDFLGSFLVLITHLSILFMFFLFLIMPFLLYYFKIKGRELRIPYVIKVFGILSLILYIGIWAIPEASPPILMHEIEDSSIRGVDLSSRAIVDNISMRDLLVLVSIGIFLFFFLMIRRERFELFIGKIFHYAILSFFIFYILIFAMSVLKESPYRDDFKIVGEGFDVYLSYYEDENTIKDRSRNAFRINSPDLKSSLNFVPASSIYGSYGNFVESFESHEDYIMIFYESEEEGRFIWTREHSKLIFEDPSIVRVFGNYIQILDFETRIVFVLGSDVFPILLEGDNLRIDTWIDSSRVFSSINLKQPSEIEERGFFGLNIDRYAQILRFIFTFLFYFFSIFAFIHFYLREID